MAHDTEPDLKESSRLLDRMLGIEQPPQPVLGPGIAVECRLTASPAEFAVIVTIIDTSGAQAQFSCRPDQLERLRHSFDEATMNVW